MSKNVKNNTEEKNEKKGIIKKNQKPNGKSEYYITTAPQKTVGGKIVIWILVALMALASVGSLIIPYYLYFGLIIALFKDHQK